MKKETNRHNFVLPTELNNKLREFSKRSGLKLNTIAQKALEQFINKENEKNP